MIIPSYINVKEEGEKIYLKSDLNDFEITINKNLIQDFKKIQSGKININKELEELLIKYRMLINVDIFNNEIFPNIYKQNNMLHLIIIPTWNCNFRCIYCYENHVSEYLPNLYLDKLCKFIEDTHDQYTAIHLDWFGGEPLLALPQILKYTKKINKIAKKYNLLFEGSMTTNGYLLNLKTFNKLYKVGCNSFQVTLDGFNHNNKRPLVGGKPSLETILSNLKSIIINSSKKNYTIMLRNNILQDDDINWYRYVHDVINADEHIQLLVKKVFSTSRIAGSKSLIDKKDYDIYKEHTNEAQKYFKICYDDLDTKKFSQICYAANPYEFTILPNGQIHKCTTTTFNEDWQSVGKITEEGVFIDKNKIPQWSEHKVSEKCLTCKDLLKCLNMKCPKIKIQLQKDNCCLD